METECVKRKGHSVTLSKTFYCCIVSNSLLTFFVNVKSITVTCVACFSLNDFVELADTRHLA